MTEEESMKIKEMMNEAKMKNHKRSGDKERFLEMKA